MGEYSLEFYVRVVYYHQDLIPLENKNLKRKNSYAQIANYPENVLADYYFKIKNIIRREWVNVVYDYQYLIFPNDKETNQKFSFNQISYFDDKNLKNYYLQIMQKLGKRPLTLEPLSTSELLKYVQKDSTCEIHVKSDVDGLINDQIYANEVKKADLLGPEEPNPHANIVADAQELWTKIQQSLQENQTLNNNKIELVENDGVISEISNASYDEASQESSFQIKQSLLKEELNDSEVERDGNDIANPKIPSDPYDEIDFEKRSFLGPTGSNEYQRTLHR
mgnify:FL=1